MLPPSHSQADCKRFSRLLAMLEAAPVQENSSVFFKRFQSCNDNTLVMAQGWSNDSLIEGRPTVQKIVHHLGDTLNRSRCQHGQRSTKPQEVIVEDAGIAADLDRLLSGITVSLRVAPATTPAAVPSNL